MVEGDLAGRAWSPGAGLVAVSPGARTMTARVMAVDMPVIPLFELDAAIGFGVIGVKPCFVAGGKGLVLPCVVEISDT